MMYIAYVKVFVDTFQTGGYCLVEAKDREEAKLKVKAYYEKELPNQIIDEIRIGITIM